MASSFSRGHDLISMNHQSVNLMNSPDDLVCKQRETTKRDIILKHCFLSLWQYLSWTIEYSLLLSLTKDCPNIPPRERVHESSDIDYLYIKRSTDQQLRSQLNWDTWENMEPMFVTFLTFHWPMFWLNRIAPSNMWNVTDILLSREKNYLFYFDATLVVQTIQRNCKEKLEQIQSCPQMGERVPCFR